MLLLVMAFARMCLFVRVCVCVCVWGGGVNVLRCVNVVDLHELLHHWENQYSFV